MGFGRGLPSWALTFMIFCIQQKASGTESPETVTIIPPPTTTPLITSFNPAHNGRVCSTWGNFYYKTFDGDIYHFPGACNYVFASHCNAPFEDFNIQIRRNNGERSIKDITVMLSGVYIKIQTNDTLVNNERVQLPYSGSGVSIEIAGNSMRLSAKQLQLMWNRDDSLMLELDEKYANQTCGLCGDFNGIPTYNEFYSNNAKLTPLQFGNMQKMNGPEEDCKDPTASSLRNCANVSNVCQEILTGPSFSDCNNVVGVNEYIEACGQDLCLCDQNTTFSCLCDTFAEYSRQCAHAGGHPQNWRSPDFCPMTCPFNMQYQECGSACADTCTNSERSQLCEDHCLDGCFCPAGMVYDDINSSGCLPIQQCSCVYNGKVYAPGTTYSDRCRSCSCSGGQWSCTEMPCPGICSVEGGSHISSYDEKRYNVHGDCTYVLSKLCDGETFTVLGELRKCGLTDTETCLKMVALSINGGLTTIVVKSSGAVFVNWIYTQLPISAANVTMFRASSFFIIAESNFGLQLEIQLVPIMQLFVRLDPSYKGKTCGLCGNFDSRQTDDFTAMSGVVEGTAPAFANTWKTQATCPNIKQNFEDPCSLSVENEKYAHHWCGLLTDSEGPFAKCHPSVNPAAYHTNCMFDTCNCERSEDCMCAVLSAYVRACAAKGVELPGWRTDVCSKYTTSCPKSLAYSYTISSCQPTCRSLSEPDITCNIKFVPVDGCTCINGTYMDESGKCVPASNCPCYYKGTAIQPSEVLHEAGVACTCAQGKLSCIGNIDLTPVCTAPMVYFDCKNATTGSTGAECQKSCHTLDMQCYSTQCMSGCVCPAGLVSDGKGNCIAMEGCPCIHNDATYNPGEEIKVDCNTCVCKNRMWKCTKNKCLGTCAVYGDGHYITFDDKRYNFNGKCEYTLLQDHCGQNSSSSFSIITENIPCGSTGTTCSKSIKVFLKNYELILSEEQSKVVARGGGGELPYRIRQMGIYLVIETTNGMIILWDKKTSIFIKISPDFKGQVCGLCGNYDGNGINDFTTRSQSVVGDVLEFGNSWKVSPTCPDAKCTKDPCSKNPYRKSWSQKQCSIINSNVFADCHSQVEPTKYYEACVTDACACDTGGDCECFCTAVAAYAQACSEFGVCISWRTPSVCPMFCDYYNAERECDWHYKSCGAPCMKTCRNPSGRCLHELPGLEGCYPYCPADKPYFNEEEMKCVDQCGCYDAEDNYYPPGTHFDLRDTCQSCTCTNQGIMCNYNSQACYCYYEGKEYIYKEVIYNTTDGLGWCMTAICDVNGTIHREADKCEGLTTTLPPFTFTTIPSTSETGLTAPATTACVHKVCEWSEWYDVSYPTFGQTNGDYETPENIRAKGINFCKLPEEVQCRAEQFPNTNIEDLNQNIQCTKDTGLICNNKDQMPPICLNYQIKFLCCMFIPCEMSSPTPTTTSIGTIATTRMPGSTTPSITETTCAPQCSWTAWFDVSSPTSDPNSGDLETLANIRASGQEVCDKPQSIECRAENHPDVPISELAQTVRCDLKNGLECLNTEQKGKYPVCLNYQVRFHCCDYTHCPPGTTPGTTTAATSTGTPASSPGATPGHTSAPPSSSTGSTPPPIVQTTTQGTTVVATSPAKGTTTTLSTPLSTGPGTTTGPGSTPAVTSATVSTTTATSLQSTPVSKPTGSIPTKGTTPQVPATSVATSTTAALPGSTTPSVIETTCSPRCSWTAWFDVSSPTSDPKSGDLETLANIRASGQEVCDKPQSIECRAENHPEVPISELAQTVRCDLKTGLECLNTEQKGKYPVCLNYQVRFHCCDYAHCPPGTTPGTTTAATSTGTPASSPGATPGHTSAPPSSSTGSTPPPIVQTTTKGTTVVATSPAKGTTTTLSTPLSTGPGTTTGPGSTPAVTSATVSTTTATSLQSTPVSKPTGSIPTKGTTPQVPATSVATSTTAALLGSTTPSVIETTCSPRCSWTAWFDVSSPTSDPKSGDLETLANIRASGQEVCDKPQSIECRAENHPDVPISELAQTVRCDLKTGLECLNTEQKGKYPVCLNYQVRFHCCDYAHCPPGTTPGTTTAATSTGTPASSPGATPGHTSAPPSSSTGSTPPPIVQTTTQGTTVVATSPAKGTTTTLSTPLSTGPGTTTGPGSTPAVTSATVSTTTATSLQSTPVSKPTGSIPTKGTTPQVPATSVTTSTTAALPGSTTPSVIETTCSPRCSWTAWFDVSSPTSDPKSGDLETLANIRASGQEVCDKPQSIECRAENHPEVPISELAQTVRCDLKTGLECLNTEQKGKYPVCLNYQVRFHCCDYAHCPPGTTPGTTTAATSTGTPASSPGATPGHTSAPPSSSTGSTPPPIVQTTTQGTTVVATSPAKGTTTTLSTPLSTGPGTTTGPGSTPAVTSATVSTTTATSLQSTPVSKPTGSIPTKGTTPQVPATSVATSTTAALPGSTTPSVIETTCSPRCSWTAWFDVSSPTSDPKSGDLETLANIRASGQEVCDKPQSIECRAENHPDVPISELAQTVRCDLKTGLECLNTEQKGKYPVCLNYQVRFHCCDYAHCPPGTTPGTTTAATSTGTPASSPGATPGHTSAPPSSSTGSTPPPIVQTTTQGTTVVATSPAKGTTTTLSTPLSTGPGTTTGPGSTPAVTSATVSTTTATSLQSTPVSKPTGSIPTKGTTPQVPATSVTTSTTAALPGSTTPSVIETTCSPRCSWTAWFDMSSPTSDPKSGDLETLANIRASGQEVCDKPQSIECRAENHPEVPISELAQTVRCDLKTGLECLNTEQKGKYPVCLNYQVRFHCCDYAHCPPGTTPGTTTAATSTGTPASSPGATPGHTSAPPSSSTGSTPPPIVQTTTQGTTVVATSPAKGTTTTLSTPLSTGPGTTTGPGSTPAVTSATVSTTTATSLQSTPVSKPTGSIPTKGTTPQVPATSVATSTTAALPGSTTPSVIETTCSPRCSWTAWFDVSSPTSDPKSGDLETLANIRASGQEVCDKPQSIECRAENHPDVPISELAQTVRCDLKTGLECLNTEQKGKYPVCLNYQVRFHCCDYAHCPPGTTPGTTTAATSTGTPASSPGATPGHTSAPPSSSTGSTPPPIVQTTTQGTTVVATSPAKGTTTTLSTPLSTGPGTTTGPGSTPAVTSATVSTTTATSLQSTPVSKPTGSIPTKGTTPQVPATSVATSTTAALPGSTTPSVIETTCSPRCSWTAWFDVSSPTSDPKSGDLETLANIRASGQEVCDKPQSIECRAENHPDVPISELAQTVRCDLKTGLECLNKEQKGKYPVCLNYQVRFHCCDYAHCPPGTTPGTTTAATSTGTPASSPGATPGHTSAPPSSSTGSTPPPIVQTTTQGTTVVATSPAKGTTTTLSTPLSTGPGTTTGPGSTPAVTSATVSTTTATSLQSTPVSKPTGSIPTKGTTPQVPATSVATSTTAALPGSTTPSVIETTCSPRCSWTAWFDVSSPTSDPKSGDLETLANIRASGQEVCDKPQSIECRAENHPDVPISELAQTVRCDLKTGLECLNTEQKGKYPVCLNYQVRFHCCDYAHCPPGTTPGTTTAATSTGTPASSPGATPGHTSAPPSSSTGSTPPPIVQTTTQGTTVVATSPAKGTTTTLSTPLSTGPGTTTGPGSTPAVTSATVSTTTATSLQSTPVSKPTGSIPTKGTTPQVPATSVATSTTAALPGSTTPSVIETTCSPRCSWTAWFDVSSPTSDPKSGDLETLANIRASGQEVCDKPQSIECRAENHPDVPISELAQTVRCDLKTGLECLNTEQKGKYPVCLNYQVRFHCCDYAHCPPGTTPGTTTAATSTGTPASSPGATPGHTSAPPSSSTGSTPPPIVQTTTQGTTVVATSPAKGTTTTLSTPLSTGPGTTTGPGSTPAVTSATVSTTTATSLQSTPVSKPTGSIPTKGTTPQVPATSVATSTTAALPGSTTPSVIETTCSPRCSWTAWFDVSSPTSDPKSGDLETLANIRASGQEVCDKPQSIECRAENHPEVPISELAQTVRCDLKTGLECLNTEQKGKYPVCLNYQVRFHCCDYAHCPPGTTPGTTTAATSTGTPASSPGATPGHTSAPPSSSTGSTPPPIVQTTTQGTTVVATSPAKGTTTTLSTPLSTGPGTTTGPGSTPAVTSATVSTTTATSLQSTPVSKPTGSIPTKGTTPQVPATSVTTSTTAALPGSTTPSVIETTCSPRCSWTAWFDVSSPTSDPKSGDLETLANIRASGQEVCDKPQSIECRAENHPEVPISELAQTVRCDLKTGLECLNTEQKGKYPVCLNYQVRFHCCDYAHCPPGTTPGTTTAATSTGTPASSPGATPGHTSTPPSSSTGSTPPPIVQTTTQGTTVVATSPAKGTTTSLSTPLSTGPGTTTGPGSTPAVTSATVSTTTATSLQSTPVSKPTGSIPTKGTTPQVPATSVATSTTAALPGSTTPSVIETTCSPRCSWTAWFDVSSPTSDPKSGDLETLANIRASGQEVCDKPQSIECRAENHPEVPISELAQTVRCDLKTGLECLNKEQKGKYPVCLNYQVRFHCCDYAHCPPGTTPGTTTAATSTGTPASSPGATPGHTSAPPSSSTGSTPPPIVQTTTQGTTVVATSPAKGTTTTLSTPLSTGPGTTTGPGSTPAVTSATVSTTTATSLQSTPVSKPTGSIPTKGTTPQVPATSVTTSTTAALPGSTTPSVIETTCSPRCSWTAWFDVSSPTSDPKSGDLETLANIRASGQEVCDKPQSIECRAENHPDVPISELAQTVRCDLKTGLECLNTEQKGKYPVCLNYQVRFHCCDYAHCPPGTTPGTTTAATSTGTPASSPGATPGHTSAPPSSSTGSTPPPIVQTTTQGTTVVATSPAKGTTTTLSTPLSTGPGTTTGPGSTPAVTSATVSTTTATSLQSTPVSKPTGSIPTKGTTPQVPATSVATSTTAALPGSTTPSVIETTCSPRCSWTAWFDVSSPTSDPKSGDLETLANIRASGQEVCDKPQSIECRAENHPEVPISELAQTVRCDLKTGLECLNTEQKGKYPVCLNYQVRFHCCDYAHCPPGTTPGTTTAATSTGTPASSPGATPGHTSAPPSSSTGSTPPPIVQTTTQGTTVVATSPAKGTTTTLSTPLSTGPGTTTGPGSTPAVTSATVSTTTATSLQSTPVSTPPLIVQTSIQGTTVVPTGQVEKTTTLSTPPSTIQGTTTSPGSTPVVTSATVSTSTATSRGTPASSPGATPGHTSAPPSSSTGSTPPPIVQTTTQGTTVVSTSPAKETTTTLSTPLSTVPGTTSSPGRTPAVTAATVSTTTAISTGTPASSPGATPGHTSAPPSSSTGSTPPPIVQTTTQGTTVVATSPGHTSGPPSSSTGSTPPPIVQTTTQGTTVVATSPAKGTTTTLSTPLSTGPGTTTGPGSTPAVTSATVSTTTATSLQSTPVSKPTGSIPTEGTTPEVKQTTTPIVEITSLPPLISTTLVVTESSPSFAHTTSTTTLSSSVTSPLSTTNGTSVTTQTSVTSVSSSTLPALTTKIATTGSTVYIPVTSSRITPCFCHVSGANGGLFSPGEVIYNRTDSSGCSFYAICDNSCEVKRSRGPCPSTTPSHPPTQAVTTVGTSPVPPTPIPTILIPSTVERTTSAPSTTTLVIPTTPAEGCPNADPPRKTNETWMFNNCSMATCEGNNRIVVVLPPPADNITCANRLPPVKINHDDGCTHHYECACVCSGWDNSHYETFDGTNYTFHDNCTYVLVQEVVKKHGNFSVLVDNYFCDPANNESCSRSIIINYKHTEIVLSSQMYNGMRTNKVIFNKEIVHASFSKDGITVADTGTTMSVEILDIQAFINFNGFTFSIQIPFDLFAFNTEGQCGTCSNDRSDDCRLPSGHKVSSCSEMAPHWKVNNGCEGVNPTPEPTGPPPTEVPCTTPSPLCELIVSDIFADCHEVLPPKVFYDRCLSEVCQNENDTLTCYSVEMYASLCINKGVCTDWRKKTEGKCPYHCPKGKVYEACGPVYPSTCDNGKSNDITEHVAEGCFCPAGQILVNSHTDTCVQDCDFCIGPDGSPQMPGTKWRSNCQECICDPLSVTVQCKAEPCSTPATPACQKEGLIPVSVLTPEDPCCPEIQCICNTSACSNRKKSCEPGYALSSVLFEGDCCVTFLCEPIPDICVVNGTVYTPGASVPSDSCEKCVCGYETDPSSKSNLVECEPVPCDTACSEGYKYQVKAGECCGTCVQVTCIININGTTQMLKPGDTWQSEANNCSYYECEKEDNELVLVNNRRTCPFFDPKECGSNETELTPDGCCKTCKLEPKCKVRTNQILIRQNECVSSELVELTYCEGACPSSSMYSTEARAMQHKCTCCQELKSHKKKVSLTCQDGTTINYDYIYVDECQCMTACIPEAAALQ